MNKELELPKCCLCGREMRVIDFSLGRFVTCAGEARDGHEVDGPTRKTDKGAVNAYNNMVAKWRGWNL